MGLLCSQGQGSTWPKPGASCTGTSALFFPGSVHGPGPPPSEEGLPVNQSSPDLHFTPFQKNQSPKRGKFFSGPSACPPDRGLPASSPWLD